MRSCNRASSTSGSSLLDRRSLLLGEAALQERVERHGVAVAAAFTDDERGR